MFVTTLIPDKNNHSIEIPEEYYGTKLTIVMNTVLENQRENTANQYLTKLELLNQSIEGYRIDMSNFKFDRNQANDYE